MEREDGDGQVCKNHCSLGDFDNGEMHLRPKTQNHLLPNEVLQHRAFPCTLPADHSDLRQIQLGILTDSREGILHFIHKRNKVFHPPVPHDCKGFGRSFLVETNEGKRSPSEPSACPPLYHPSVMRVFQRLESAFYINIACTLIDYAFPVSPLHRTLLLSSLSSTAIRNSLPRSTEG